MVQVKDIREGIEHVKIPATAIHVEIWTGETKADYVHVFTVQEYIWCFVVVGWPTGGASGM